MSRRAAASEWLQIGEARSRRKAPLVALSLSAIALVAWVVAAASGAEAYASVAAVLGGWFGTLLLLGFSASFFLHLGNGIRHLFWDAGYGFAKSTAHKSGVFTLVAAAVLTLAFWMGAFA